MSITFCKDGGVMYDCIVLQIIHNSGLASGLYGYNRICIQTVKVVLIMSRPIG